MGSSEIDAGVLNQMSSLFLGDSEQGNLLFHGPTSNYSLFSPGGLDWLSSKTHSSELCNLIRCRVEELPSASHASSEMQEPLSGKRIALPPKADLDEIINDYFIQINSMFLPVISEARFRKAYAENPNPNPNTNPSLYAAISFMIVKVHMLIPKYTKASQNRRGGEQIAVTYMANCWSVFNQLSISRGDILTVQVMLSMAMTLEAFLDVESAYILLASAVRITFRLGLHRSAKGKLPSNANETERQLLFWIVYSYDKVLSIRLGRPPYIGDNDAEINLPDDEEFLRTYGNPGSSLVILYLMRLAQITNKVYSNFYTEQASKQTFEQYKETAAQLHEELKTWRLRAPIEILINLAKTLGNEAGPIALAPHLLQVRYYETVSLLYHARYRGYTTSSPSEVDSLNNTRASIVEEENRWARENHLRCLNASRNIIRVLDSAARGTPSPDRFVLCYISHVIFSAYLTIFVNLMNNPPGLDMRSDLALLSIFIQHLSPALLNSGSPNGRLLASLSATLQSIAEKFVACPAHLRSKGSGERMPNSDLLQQIMMYQNNYDASQLFSADALGDLPAAPVPTEGFPFSEELFAPNLSDFITPEQFFDPSALPSLLPPWRLDSGFTYMGQPIPPL